MRRLFRIAATTVLAGMPSWTLADPPALPITTASPATPVTAALDAPAVRKTKTLREIGHVTATTPFCSAFAAGGAPAAESALRFEQRLAITSADFNSLDLTHEIAKTRTIRMLDDDALALARDARDGRDELATLRKNALADPDRGSDANKALVAFADALRGAQGREYELSKDIANLVGTLDSMPVPSIADGPSDAIDSFARPTNVRTALIADTAIGGASPLRDHLFTLPSNAALEDDLARAATHAQDVETLGNCR